MDSLSWKSPIKMDDLGVPLFLETPIYPTFFSSISFFAANVTCGFVEKRMNLWHIRIGEMKNLQTLAGM